MSIPKPELRNDVEAIRFYIQLLSSYSFVQSIWLGGSRTPLSPKNSTAQSDWDLQLIMGTDARKDLPQPIDLGVHADLFFFKEPSKYAVQLWPVDQCGILTG